VPEGRRKLAGGVAQRSHRNWTKSISRPGRDAGLGFAVKPIQVLRHSRARGILLCASGGYAALHHRLISAAPPGRRLVYKLLAHAPHTAYVSRPVIRVRRSLERRHRSITRG